MTPSEVRAAALRQIKWASMDHCDYVIEEHDDPDGLQRIEDAEATAEHILATVTADDDEPVTEEFVASLNPPRYWEAGREYSWPTVGLRYACELAGVSGVGEPGFYIDGRYEPLFLKHLKTRGQLRLLLTGLGIKLKGGA